MGDARKAQSDFFVRKRSAERITNDVDNMEITQQTKRTREHLEIPRIAVDNQHNNSNPDEIIITATTIPHSETAEQILAGNRNAIRHDRLLDKIDRYTSHNKFIRRCLTDNIIPISYKVTVEPSIGNHDEDFLKGYYDMMDGFSKKLMEYTANYCERKISDFDKEKLTSEEDLKSLISEETYAELTKALGTNQDKRKKALQEVKDKKFIRLKYRSQQQNQRQFHENTPNSDIVVHREFQQRGIASRKNSRTNLSGQREPTRNHSKTRLFNVNSNYVKNRSEGNGYENKLNELERQLTELRQVQNHTHYNSYSHVLKKGMHSNNRVIPTTTTTEWDNYGTTYHSQQQQPQLQQQQQQTTTTTTTTKDTNNNTNNNYNNNNNNNNNSNNNSNIGNNSNNSNNSNNNNTNNNNKKTKNPAIRHNWG